MRLQKGSKGKDITSKLEFLPEWIRGIANTDWFSLWK